MESSATSHRVSVMPSVAVAASLVLLLQSMRVFFTLVVNYYGGRVGLVNAAPIVLGVFMAPFLVGVFGRWTPTRSVLLAELAGLVVLRIATQFVTSSGPRLTIAGAATMLGLLTIPLLLAHVRALDPIDGSRAAYRFVVGALWGLIADVSINGLFLTWDVAWRTGAVPAIVVIGECGVATAVIVTMRSSLCDRLSEPPMGAGISAVVLGPFLAAHVMMLSNVGFAASHGLSIPFAVALVLAGEAIGLIALNVAATRGVSRRSASAAFGCTIVVAIMMPPKTGLPGMIAFVVAHALAATAAYVGLVGTPGAEPRASAWRTAVTVGVSSILFVVPPIAYFYGQREPLPVVPVVMLDVVIVLVAIGFVPALICGAVRVTQAFGLRRQLVPLALIPILVGLTTFVSGTDVSNAVVTDGTFRLLDFNVSYGVDRDGQVDPEGIARAIESQHPDVVTLQEVTRGWLIAGSVDLFDWLGHRLGMPYTTFAPAADRQFGNVVLSRFPMVEVSTAQLPIGSESQRRSYLRVVLDVGPEQVTIYDVHLSAWSDSPTRLGQIEKVLASWGSRPRTIVAGDMNASPGEVEMDRMVEAGFRSAQDIAGDPSANTSTDPDERIDWIYGTSDLDFRDFTVVESRASDHLPIVATVVLHDI